MTPASRSALVSGKTYTFSGYPSITEVYPDAGSILMLGGTYGTSSQYKPGFKLANQGGTYSPKISYTITGPLGTANSRVIYTALGSEDVNDLGVTINGALTDTFKFQHAKGVAAGSNGDMTFPTASLVGGQYRVDAVMNIASANYTQTWPSYTFNVALANDLELTKFIRPVQNTKNKYALTSRIPVILSLRNVGFNPVTNATGHVRIYFGNETTPVYDETVTSSYTDVPITTNGSREMEFPEYLPTRGVGTYRVSAEVTLNNATDLYLANNTISDADFAFDVAYDVELEAYAISNPDTAVSLGRPIIPCGVFRNHGISDVPQPVPCRMVVTNTATGAVIYDQTEMVESILQLPSNIETPVYFQDNLIINQAGTYLMTLSVTESNDPIQTNNVYSKTITVYPGMHGTYTVGTTGDYATIGDACSAAYLRGIDGSVIFKLIDPEYNITNLDQYQPAIDLSGDIVGNNATNTITFEPGDALMESSNPIVINMNPTSGIGVKMGQNNIPSYNDAAVNFVFNSRKKDFSNAGGYITINGGENRNLRFVLKSNANFRSAFYLGQGASHNTIENCEIIDSSSAADYAAIPGSLYNSGLDKFIFERNTALSGGIVMRSISPYDAKQYDRLNLHVNTYNLDTLCNSYNTISNNMISGFGIGVASMGIGVLEKNIEGTFTHTKFYNNNNTISNNEILNTAKTGIFLGFEEDSKVSGNRIDNVTGNYATLDDNGKVGTGIQTASNNNYAAGIVLGGEKSDSYFGYNTMRITVSNNEISNVTSNSASYGIKDLQCENRYLVTGSSSLFEMPDANERNIFVSNAIWNLLSGAATTNRAGLSLSSDGIVSSYRSRSDVVANNTIKLGDDNFAATTGNTCGISLSKVNGTQVFNNAIEILEGTYGENGHSSLIAYDGQMPATDNVTIDRNVYWYNTSAQNNDLAYFGEKDPNGVQYPNTGYINEYKNLKQWQYWTNCDSNSYFYDFSNEIGVNSDNELRIQQDAQGRYPMNSKLNNIGYKYDEITVDGTLLKDIISTSDIDGSARGIAGARYDAGASEFTGRVYLRDLEVVKLTSPITYESATGEFAGVNYVMTTDPVDIKALIRNNGNMDANNVPVRVTITHEAVKEIDSTISESYISYVSVPAYNNAVLDFHLGSSEPPSFIPQTYKMLVADAAAPAQFAKMVTTVTPVYTINVEVLDDGDQDAANNSFTDNYRFFIKKSNLSVLLSAEHTTFDLSNTSLYDTANVADYTDKVAGKLNYDSLKLGFNRLGWYQYVNAEPAVYHFDVFDRSVWEPRSVNYNAYKTLFWSDGDDKALLRTQEQDLRNFVANDEYSATNTSKKNLVIGSQEFLRSNTDTRAAFLTNYMKADNVTPGNPRGENVSYADNRLRGIGLSINKVESIVNTGFEIPGPVAEDGTETPIFTDATSYPALMSIPATGDGISVPAYYFMTHAGNDSIAGVCTSALTRNVVYLGLDWRHWANLDTVLRGILDYNARNGSDVVPVELLDFDAIDRNNRVELGWSTVSEYNLASFEVERRNAAGTFETIATVPASGTSTSIKSYGPVTDRDVSYGHTYTYRLRSIDRDGGSTLSNEVEVTLDDYFGIAPNPASTTARYSFNIGNANAAVELFDLDGKLVRTLYNGTVGGSMTLDIDVTSLANGTYTVVLRSGDQVYTTPLHVRK